MIKKVSLFRIINLIALILMFSCLNGAVLSQDGAAPSLSAEKPEAEKAWEALIKVKGGREKLHSVTNMLTEFQLQTRLDIFPNKYWAFNTYLDGTPGVGRTSGSADKMVSDYTGPDGIIHREDEKSQMILSGLRFQRIRFLLETKWDKPELVRVTRIKKDKRIFDVIETKFEGKRMDFVFDPEEMLVKEVYEFRADNKTPLLNHILSNYTTIDGIKMPQTFSIGDTHNNFKPKLKYFSQIKFTFNVEYDPQLFARPLKLTTPDAWKRGQ